MDKHHDKILCEWLNHPENKIYKIKKVAEVGSAKVNNYYPTIRDIVNKIYNVTLDGFDVVKWEGVDIVLKEGKVPKKYQNKYNYVICLGTIGYGNDYKILQEIDLLSSSKGSRILISIPKVGGEKSSLFYSKNPKVRTKQGFKNLINKKFPNFYIHHISEDNHAKGFIYFYLYKTL